MIARPKNMHIASHILLDMQFFHFFYFFIRALSSPNLYPKLLKTSLKNASGLTELLFIDISTSLLILMMLCSFVCILKFRVRGSLIILKSSFATTKSFTRSANLHLECYFILGIINCTPQSLELMSNLGDDDYFRSRCYLKFSSSSSTSNKYSDLPAL